MIIKDIIAIRSLGNFLILETESGIDIRIGLDSTPSYIDLETLSCENKTGLQIVVSINWDN